MENPIGRNRVLCTIWLTRNIAKRVQCDQDYTVWVCLCGGGECNKAIGTNHPMNFHSRINWFYVCQNSPNQASFIYSLKLSWMHELNETAGKITQQINWFRQNDLEKRWDQCATGDSLPGTSLANWTICCACMWKWFIMWLQTCTSFSYWSRGIVLIRKRVLKY